MKDLIDNDINVGDYVACALIIGQSANLSVGQVVAIDAKYGIKVHSLKRTYGGPPNKPTWLKFSDRIIVLNKQDFEVARDEGRVS